MLFPVDKTCTFSPYKLTSSQFVEQTHILIISVVVVSETLEEEAGTWSTENVAGVIFHFHRHIETLHCGPYCPITGSDHDTVSYTHLTLPTTKCV